jgi:hypothetical protein
MKLESGLQEGLDHEAIKVRGKQNIGALREQEAGFRPPRCRFRILSVIDTMPGGGRRHLDLRPEGRRASSMPSSPGAANPILSSPIAEQSSPSTLWSPKAS